MTRDKSYDEPVPSYTKVLGSEEGINELELLYNDIST